MMCAVDYFPGHFSTQESRLSVPTSYYGAETFQIRVCGNMVYFEDIPIVDGATYGDYAQHFEYVLKAAISPTDSLEEIMWRKAHQRLRRPFGKFNRKMKNSDVSLAFRFNHVYLVKRFFTFGLRKTGPGVCHIYQTHSTPLLFYSPNIDITDKEKSFIYEDQRHYACHVLEPDSVYLVPENSTYLIMAVDKSLFAVDALVLSDVRSSSDYKSPLQTSLREYAETCPDYLNIRTRREIGDVPGSSNNPHRICPDCRRIANRWQSELPGGPASPNAIQYTRDAFRGEPSQVVDRGVSNVDRTLRGNTNESEVQP